MCPHLTLFVFIVFGPPPIRILSLFRQLSLFVSSLRTRSDQAGQRILVPVNILSPSPNTVHRRTEEVSGPSKARSLSTLPSNREPGTTSDKINPNSQPRSRLARQASWTSRSFLTPGCTESGLHSLQQKKRSNVRISHPSHALSPTAAGHSLHIRFNFRHGFLQRRTREVWQSERGTEMGLYCMHLTWLSIAGKVTDAFRRISTTLSPHRAGHLSPMAT